MSIFETTKAFPIEEKYSLTDQIRRSSRSVCANLAEASRKKIYSNHFISKLTDSDAENTETQSWLGFSFSCQYINQETFGLLTDKSVEVGKLLNYMITNPESSNNPEKMLSLIPANCVLKSAFWLLTFAI
jgi:four helix bundle protein